MKLKNSFLIVAFILTTLACATLTKPIPNATQVVVPSATQNLLPTIELTPSEPTSTVMPTTVIPTEMAITTPGVPVLEQGDDECRGGDWEFKPTATYRYPMDNGTDIVIIDLSIHNGSDQFPATANFQAPVLTTDDGKAYRPFNPLYKPVIPDNPHSPYSGKEYEQYYGGKTEQIAPGATSLGSTPLVQHPKFIPYTFGYEIPSERKLYKLRVLDVQIECQVGQDVSDPYSYGYSQIYEVNYLLGETPLSPLPTEITEPLATFDPNSINTVCKNPYYPAVEGATWIYQLTDNKNSTLYLRIIFSVDPTNGDIYVASAFNLTDAFPPPRFTGEEEFCEPRGITLTNSNLSTDIYVSNSSVILPYSVKPLILISMPWKRI